MSNTARKVIEITKNGNSRELVVSHVTVRESISFLLLKIIVIEILSAFGVIVLHSSLFSQNLIGGVNIEFGSLFLPAFIALILFKISLLIFVSLQWLNEYYEITPIEIIHKSGIFFRNEEKHTLNHLGSLKVHQGFFGKILNYGTLTVYNWVQEKEIFLYLIHNPMKYHAILKKILPEADDRKEVIRERIFEEERL